MGMDLSEGDTEELEIEIDASQDVEPLRTAPSPELPSATAVEEHRHLHVPYRDWCKFCVMGRGTGLPHGRSGSSTIPLVGLDYFYITTGGVKIRTELEFAGDGEGNAALEKAREDGKIIKCLVVRCLHSKMIFGHVIPYKGAGEDQFVVGLVVADIAWLGHTKMILKSDNEPALQTLVEQALERARVQCRGLTSISQEHPPAYDSQSNGGVEVGIRLIRGLFRTLKLCTEARLDKFVPVDHPLVSWLLEHTCLILSVRVRGSDGLTAWARVRGRAFNQRMLSFAESVLYKLPTKGPRAAPDGNMGTRWAIGTFLGYSRNSNCYLVSTADGVIPARSLQRRPSQERWSPDEVAHSTNAQKSKCASTNPLPSRPTLLEPHARPPSANYGSVRRTSTNTDTL